MTISSRTPEGLPSRCPLCGAATNLEYSDPGDDATCPNCGHLLWKPLGLLSRFKNRFAESFFTDSDQIESSPGIEKAAPLHRRAGIKILACVLMLAGIAASVFATQHHIEAKTAARLSKAEDIRTFNEREIRVGREELEIYLRTRQITRAEYEDRMKFFDKIEADAKAVYRAILEGRSYHP